jgi:hypothetical protein
MAHEKLDVELGFDLGDGGRDGRLGDVESLGGELDALGLAGGDEIKQLP